MRNTACIVLALALVAACDTSEPLAPIDPPQPRPEPTPLFAPSTCPDLEWSELETTAWVLSEASNGALFIGAVPVTSALSTAIDRSFPAPDGAVDLAALPDDTLAVLTENEVVIVDTSDGRVLSSLGASEGAFTIGFDGTHVVLGRDDDVIVVSVATGARVTRAIAREQLPEFDGDTDRPFPPRLPSEQAPVLRQVVPLVDTQLLLMETDGVPEPIVPPFDGVVVSSNAPARSSAFALLAGRAASLAPDFVTTFLVHAVDVDGTDIELKDVDTAGSDGCHVVVVERFVIDGERYQTLSFHRPDRVRYVVDGAASWTRESDGTIAYAQVPFQPRILAATGAWLP